MRVYCATSNPGKLREFRLAGAAHGIEVEPVPGLADIPAPHETGNTFEENAVLKAEYYSRFVDGWVFADDSGLEVDALGGAPGVYSARFAALDTGAPGNSGDAENNAKLLALLADVPGPRRTARFRCVLALTEVTASGAGATKLFEGVCEGRLGLAPQGRAGFGYDPLFFPTGSERSFAQLGQAEKNEISHRARALAGLRHFLQVPPPPHRPPGRPGWPRRKGGVSRRTA